MYVRLFFSNFLLFAIAGGIRASQVRVFHPSGSVAGSTASVLPVVPGDSLKPAGTNAQPEPAQLVKLRRKIPLAVLIAGYISGGGFFGVLSCELAYTRYGLGAVLLTLLGLGAVGALNFLWGRALTNNLIRMRTSDNRSRALRRYRQVWLTTVLGLLAAQVFVVVQGQQPALYLFKRRVSRCNRGLIRFSAVKPPNSPFFAVRDCEQLSK